MNKIHTSPLRETFIMFLIILLSRINGNTPRCGGRGESRWQIVVHFLHRNARNSLYLRAFLNSGTNSFSALVSVLTLLTAEQN